MSALPSKVDMCAAKRETRFTLNSDRESGPETRQL
jgi:hypothetical protein